MSQTQCQRCGVLVDDDDAIHTKLGTFCTQWCADREADEAAIAAEYQPYVPVMSDEWQLWDPESPPDTTTFCHP